MKRFLLLCFLITYSAFELKAQKAERIAADSINGVYIPKNLYESLEKINSFWDDSTKRKVFEWTEDEFATNAHFGFGRWMRNNWGLWGGSRLSVYFNKIGVHHPEDMSSIILISYHRSLVGKEIELEKQVKIYQEYWDKAKKEEKVRKEKEFSVYSKGDTVEFSYAFDFISKRQEESYMDDSCVAYGIVVDTNKAEQTILVKLISACDKKGIISSKYSLYDKSGKLISKDQIEVMVEGEEKWLTYDIWQIR